ncbi:MAG TPA: sporulation protein YqfD [Candidatus Blautia pullistercoris]|uniref:Sporulation protein YqfD n=1 Tax=Candidatus Blautia pullistercoris TaxID=2838499 RepID=A0A9D1VN84_9FIRM|nr:sporulation protein YqfD [Clostridiales bacterium]HIX38491.1 sporulation protein YqfD [Candidatus Blautia pullistercoris]
MGKWEFYRKGYVRLRFWGEDPERFLNLCAYHKVPVWNLVSREKMYEMNTSVEGFRRLKGICRKSRVKIKIIGKHGLPFFFYRNKKRKAFFLGFFLGLGILFLLSRHIWNIHVEGNVYNSTQTILNYLEELDVRHGVLKKDLDCSYIAAQMREKFPDITWVSAKISGSRLILEIKENGALEESKEAENTVPVDLTAQTSGTIVSMVTRQGTPLKRQGDTCAAGEVLVSGRLDIKNDSGEIIGYEYTQADGDIYIQHDLEYYQEFSMDYEKPVYTGEKKKGLLLQLGDYYLRLEGKSPWEDYDRVTSLHQIKVTENFKLPVYYGSVTDYAYEKRTFTYSESEARQKAEENLNRLLESLEEKGVQISGNHVKIEIQGKTCTARGTLTVIEKNEQKTLTEILEQPTERNMQENE